MIAHSLVQGGPGFTYLAPGIFWYIATGDLRQAVGRSSFIDVGDIELAAFLEREKNREEVVQCLALHDTIIKHKAGLDQFRNGLKILGLLKEVEAASSKFVAFFIHQDDAVSANYVKQLLKLEFSEDRQIRQPVCTIAYDKPHIKTMGPLFLSQVRNSLFVGANCVIAAVKPCSTNFSFTVGKRKKSQGAKSVATVSGTTAVGGLPGWASSLRLSLPLLHSAYHRKTVALEGAISSNIPVSFDDYLHFESSMIAMMKGKAYNTA
eukprot:gene8368-9266_t